MTVKIPTDREITFLDGAANALGAIALTTTDNNARIIDGQLFKHGLYGEERGAWAAVKNGIALARIGWVDSADGRVLVVQVV